MYAQLMFRRILTTAERPTQCGGRGTGVDFALVALIVLFLADHVGVEDGLEVEGFEDVLAAGGVCELEPLEATIGLK